MKRTIPLSNLKNTTGIVNYCKECKIPVFVTRNGTVEMVIMDSDFYDKYFEPYILNGEIDISKVLEYFPLFMNIKDLKNTGEVSKKVSESKQAVHILKNGMSELVIMNLDVYNRYRENALKDLKKIKTTWQNNNFTL